ncbi:peptidylprolyl isomerase [Henriciella aquimarina]|uniref:peptidylprolyl isomerase n=1 Tax=Henriciella aquimarina TaxID=545261 RepID=UPI001301F274|nr:peptidylprolyl isomerase [Henriciella aquimarina]
MSAWSFWKAAVAGLALGPLLLAPASLAQESDEAEAEAGADDAIPEDAWRAVDPDNLLLIETEEGTVTIELNPGFAPNHVERIRKLAQSGILNGEHFYRVIDGFVAQAGVNEEVSALDWPALEAENDRAYGNEGFIALGNRDLFAPEVGHIEGFPVARNQLLQQEWLLHCPGAVAMARDTGPDTGSTEFYIVLDAQRYLDRNLTVFGRVIDGMEHVQAFPRGDRSVENGVLQPPEAGETILDFYIASDLPEDERPQWQVMQTNSIAFEDFKVAKRIRNEEFFYRTPPAILDICSFQVPARRIDDGADEAEEAAAPADSAMPEEMAAPEGAAAGEDTETETQAEASEPGPTPETAD